MPLVDLRCTALIVLVGCAHADRMDFAQADLMLQVLSAKPASAAQLDAVMAQPGTRLVIAQQNISREVTAQQYRTILGAYAADAAPVVPPADDSERAKRGVTGLHDDVWPALHWGAQHVAEIRAHLVGLHRLAAAERAATLVVAWLPDPVAPAVQLHIVAGGRAGAASIDHDIYFDVLASAYKANIGALSAYPSDQQVIEYFAHEMHHVGLGALVQRLRARLVLDADAARAFELVTAILMEGTATYFINAHGDLAGMRADPQYADHLAHADDLLATVEQLLGETIAHRMPADAFEQASTPLVASGYHSAGALIADAIYRAGGKPAIDRVMRDPRRLLVEYNAAVARLGEHLRPFAPSVADGIAGLGELARRRDSD
jgi:hypothetical protein